MLTVLALKLKAVHDHYRKQDSPPQKHLCTPSVLENATERFEEDPSDGENSLLLKQFVQNMMTSSNGNIFRITGPLWENLPFTVNSPHKGQWRGFDVFFDLRLNKRLSKQPRQWWFESPSHSLWPQCKEILYGLKAFEHSCMFLCRRVEIAFCTKTGLPVCLQLSTSNYNVLPLQRGPCSLKYSEKTHHNSPARLTRPTKASSRNMGCFYVIRFMLCCCHCSTICDIVIYWTAF